MSIKGIDAQIMISRSSDLVRDASAMQKRPEVQQEFLAAQQKAADAHNQASVSRTTESEMENIRTDVDGRSGGGAGGEGSGSEEEKERDESLQSMLVPPDEHIIDIKI